VFEIGLLISALIGVQGRFGKLLEAWGSIVALEEHETNFSLSTRARKDTSNGGQRKTEFLPIILKDVKIRYARGAFSVSVARMDIGKTGIVALVGETGSGKTTLLGTILGLIEPSSGKISYAGNSELALDSFLRYCRIGYVSQDDAIFSGTLLENISMYEEHSKGKKEVEERAIESAKKAELHQAILRSVQGYYTKMEDSEFDLSGGEKRRLCLARSEVSPGEVLPFSQTQLLFLLPLSFPSNVLHTLICFRARYR
jgi:ABC-type multidrug transport system fused ATPase/permease subunit